MVFGKYALINNNGKFSFKKHKIGGVSGYCLLDPPNFENYLKTYSWFLLGGVIVNAFLSTITLIFILVFQLNSLTSFFFLLVFTLTGYCLAILNLIPRKISVGSDGCILKSIQNKEALKINYNLCKVDNLMFKGMRLKNISYDSINVPLNANFDNPIFVSAKILESSKYFDKKEYKKAEKICEELLNKSVKLTEYSKYILLSDNLYFKIIKGDESKIDKLFAKKLKKYIKSNQNIYRIKGIQYAYELPIKEDIRESKKLWDKFFFNLEDKIFEKGEIESESETMRYIDEIAFKKGIL